MKKINQVTVGWIDYEKCNKVSSPAVKFSTATAGLEATKES